MSFIQTIMFIKKEKTYKTQEQNHFSIITQKSLYQT